MRCPTLNELPPPPPGKTGWPWTEETAPLPDRMPDGAEWPRISIVTPSYNQGEFIEETIRSILLQGYPNLEYIIIDGGSNDNTVEIIHKYSHYLAYWVSEPDSGQANALNKGFSKATGDLIGWQNSDDYYHQESFKNAACKISDLKDIDVIYGIRTDVDGAGNFLRDYPVSEFEIKSMIPFLNMCNQSMFIKRRIFKEENLIDEKYHHAMDQEFFLRLAIKGYKFQFVPEIGANYREHPRTKGSTQEKVYVKEFFQLYKTIYENKELDESFRKKAFSCMCGVILDNFAKGRLEFYRQSVRELKSVAGCKSLTWEILGKYLISLVGVSNIEKIRKIIHGFRKKGVSRA